MNESKIDYIKNKIMKYEEKYPVRKKTDNDFICWDFPRYIIIDEKYFLQMCDELNVIDSKNINEFMGYKLRIVNGLKGPTGPINIKMPLTTWI